MHLKMRLDLWTSDEVETYLSGDAQILRSTYFGELILTDPVLAKLHELSVSPIKRRWRPEVHQIVDAERSLNAILGERSSWSYLLDLASTLKEEASVVARQHYKKSLVNSIKEVSQQAKTFARTLSIASASLSKGDLEVLSQVLSNLPSKPSRGTTGVLHQLRAANNPAALQVTNTVADSFLAADVLLEVQHQIEKRIVAIVAEAGNGKTQLGAQLTAPQGSRPAGLFLHGRDLGAHQSLDALARTISISGTPVASMDALLAALNAAGERACCRLPIVIDGLNESEDPRDWKALLASLNQNLARYPYVLVVCTVRPAFTEIALPAEITQLEIKGFGDDSPAAIRKYLKYYKIDFEDVELPLELLKHPLTLSLFCQVANPSREKIVGVESIPGSLTAVFIGYFKQASERIEELANRARPYSAEEVGKALQKIGKSLWEEKSRTLVFDSVRAELGENGVPWKQSIVNALEQEGILLRFPTERQGSYRVAPAYDAMAGYLIADAILSTSEVSTFERWLATDAIQVALLGSIHERHPLAQDIFRAFAGLVPRKLNRQFWKALKTPAREVAIQEAANLEAPYLDVETVNEIANLIWNTPKSQVLFNRLWQTRGSVEHPLNSEFLESIIHPLKIADRDLVWSEWIRHHRRSVLGDLDRLETQWRSEIQRRNPADRLRARWVKWMLTSTVRELRDRATRSLFWFGRGDSAALFDLTIESISVNDPYVSERMLAASYGVALILHQQSTDAKFRDETLPKFARSLFSMTFAPGAPFSSTHTLRRDYAKGIIDLALRLHSEVLTSMERQSLRPPFDGGIRNWRRKPVAENEKYGGPLDFDWENYVMGGLARNRSTYDYTHPDFVCVKEQILWRIHDLGYSNLRFGPLDKEISQGPWRYTQEHPVMPEAYVQKYGWIAFYELAGLREDLGLLEHKPWRGDEPHPDEADIDPTFPGQPSDDETFKEDLLGEKFVDPINWVKRGPIPRLHKYFLQDQYDGESGPWILAELFRSKHSKTISRTGFVSIRAFFVDANELEKLREIFTFGEIVFQPQRRNAEIQGFFAGELLWRDDVPYAQPEPLQRIIGTRKVEVPASPEIVVSVGNETLRVGGARSRWRDEPMYEAVRLVPLSQSNSFSVRGNGLERPSAETPSKQICDFAGLRLGLPSWDTYDIRARRISITSTQSLYIRRETVQAYMREKRADLIWFVLGERQRLSGAGMNAGYKQYRQAFLWTRQTIEKLYESQDDHDSATQKTKNKRLLRRE